MASLFNTRISDTYSGLIKTIDNAALTASLKELTDGSGLASGIYMNTAGDFKVTAILEFGSLKDTAENIIITKFVDAADGVLNNDNDTSIPTTAAIIDYVQGHVTLQDLDFQGDTGTGSVDLDSQLLDIEGTANEITTLASGQKLTISLKSTGVVLPNGSTATTQTAGDNSTKIATTSYVDTLDAASDLDFSGDSGTGDVNLNTQTFAVTGTTNQIVTAASGQGLSLSLPATVHRNLQGDVTGNIVGNLTGTVNSTSVLADGVTATTQASSDDSTKVATTAYVKSLNNASDLDFTTDSGSGAVILNSQTFSVVGTTNEIETSGSNQQIQIGLPSSINVNVTGNTTGTHTGAVVGNVTGDVVGDLTGNADTATKWQTARDLSLTGQATGTISSVDGSGNVSGAVTLDNNSVTGKVLTGLTTPSASSILATDTILEGFGKVQSQINGLAGGLRFMGSWDADTNSPVLSSGGGEAANGTTTATTANKLVDSSASFTSTVTVGDQVVNQVDGQTALVTNVDSNTTLSIDADIMLTGEAYTIDNSPFITQGHYYVVSVGGTTTLNGISNWTVGDWVIAGANNQWTKLDHSQVDGTGTTGNLTKWSATQVIADSIVSESGSAITVDGSLTTNTNLSSTGDFAVNTDKFTVAAASGNTAFAGDLAINTNKFTVNATTGNTLVAGTLDVTGKSTFGDDITISDGTPILDFEDTDNTDNNWRMEARGSFGGFFFQSFDNNFQTGSTVLFAKYSNGYIGLGGNTNPQAQLDITGGLITSGNATFAGSVNIADYIYHIGDGDTYIGFPAANEFKLVAGGNNIIAGDVNSAYLYFQGSSKLQTTSTGVSVTGGVNASSTSTFLGNGAAAIKFGNTSTLVTMSYSGTTGVIRGESGSALQFDTNGVNTALTLDTSQNATFAGTIFASNNNPAYSFASDTNTGMSRTGTHQIAFINQGNTSLTLDALSRATFAGNILFDGSGIISTNTSDGSDNAQLSLAGGGADSDGRGARMRLYGNEHSSLAGVVDLSTGNIAGANMYLTSKDLMLFNTAGGERMRITSAGIIEAVADISAYTNTQTVFAGYGDTDAGEYGIALNTAGDGLTGSIASNLKYSNGTITQLNSARSSGEIKFSNTTTASQTADISFGGYYKGTTTFVERMRITSGGDVGISTTSAAEANEGLWLYAQGIYLSKKTGTGIGTHCIFQNNAGVTPTTVGTIQSTGSTTSYNTSSDYRLKEDLKDFAGLDMVSKIPVYDFKWKSDESRSYGVIAHELQEVLPQAVSGDKDAEEMQSVDYSKIVPLLVKSIQELKAEVDKLKQECKCKN